MSTTRVGTWEFAAAKRSDGQIVMLDPFTVLTERRVTAIIIATATTV
jgi:hypothetical protein